MFGKKKIEIPKGLFISCSGCKQMLFSKEVEDSLNICPQCGRHLRVKARKRIEYLTDKNSFEELFADLRLVDPLKFKWKSTTYKKRLKEKQNKSGENEAMLVGRAFIKGREVILIVFEFNFLGGSMGFVVGEKFCLAVEKAMKESLPLVAIICSGGARMQEGVVSLFQMAKTAAVLAKFKQGSRPFISVLTDPTYGGVTASFAMLGDVIIAEPGAMIGFAGPGVIKETMETDLPPGFQTAEFLLKRGFVDMIVHRRKLRDEISRLIDDFQEKK
jgi:acetyl-CoA carboxylase carboxyl transferase subunit beta